MAVLLERKGVISRKEQDEMYMADCQGLLFSVSVRSPSISPWSLLKHTTVVSSCFVPAIQALCSAAAKGHADGEKGVYDLGQQMRPIALFWYYPTKGRTQLEIHKRQWPGA